jgi:hypothetical protein
MPELQRATVLQTLPSGGPGGVAPPRWYRWLAADAPLRGVLDLAWGLVFVGVMVALWAGSSSRAPLQAGIELALVTGQQRFGIFRGTQRLGGVDEQVRRTATGWRLVQRFSGAGGGANAGPDLGTVALELRRDLSLARIDVAVDVARLTRLAGSLVAGVLPPLPLGLERLTVRGDCDGASGYCALAGRVLGHRFDQAVRVGRGPVLPSAIYPLLVRGVLGQEVELGLFDPLTLSRRVITYRLLGRRTVAIGGRRIEAMRVQQDLAGLRQELWLDARGRLLREEWPLQVYLQQEGDPD